MNAYANFLINRIFIRNGFGSVEKLMSAIKVASDITVWREQKGAFNNIALKAPFRDDTGYVLTYADVPAFIDAECKAWKEFTENG